MCGVVGGISNKDTIQVILNGLSHLEYRGYDSVGVAVINFEEELMRKRIIGRVKTLSQMCEADAKFKGQAGIGHTRWATHGEVNVINAHPHLSHDIIAVVHNGIIENHHEIRDDLIAKGYIFESDTDTEAIAHLIHYFYIQNNNLLDAVQSATQKLLGAYAIGVLAKNSPHEVICAKLGSPLILGVGEGEMFFASDISALIQITQKIVYLEEGDIAKLTLANYKVINKNGEEVTRAYHLSSLNLNQANLGQYRYYMQKEILEQPRAISDTLQCLGEEFDPKVFGDKAWEIFNQITKVQIIACGTSYNAGLIAKYWIEEYANLECSVEIASEYHYRKVVVDTNCLIVNISQSGETADTLASVKYAHSLGMTNSLSICNVPESSLVRLSKLHVLTQAGIEIGVASTKAFTTQLVVLLYFAFTLAKVKGLLDKTQEEVIMKNLKHLPQLISQLFSIDSQIQEVANSLEHTQNALFLGRHVLYPIAIEGALKLKEISYIHAESYAGGELKHGPLALIDNKMPVIILMPSQLLVDKVKSGVQEILARQGMVYLFTDCKNSEVHSKCYKVVNLPLDNVPSYLIPILYVVPLQLLAYYTALAKGTDVDKPRNLAKSVTVE